MKKVIEILIQHVESSSDTSPAYTSEIYQAIEILKMVQMPLVTWTQPLDGVIHVPDMFDPLINSIAHQIKCCTISGLFSEEEMMCRIAFAAQKFFHFQKS